MEVELNWPQEQPALDDGELVLRPWRSDDADAVYRACQDDQIQRYTMVPVPYLPEHAVHYVEVVGPVGYAGRTEALFAVTARSSGDVLGSCGLVTIDLANQVGYAGYWIAPWARQRRVASQALELVTAWALSQLGLGTVYLEIEPDNAASVGTARLAGFTMKKGPPVQREHRGAVREFNLYERTRPGR